MLLSTSAPEESNSLALKVSNDSDKHIALMARLQLLKNETLNLWRGNDQPKPAARMCVRQILGVLEDLHNLQETHSLHGEIIAYATSFASEASLLAGEVRDAERFALEACWHAEGVGMVSLAATARFQLANIAIYQDQFDLALTQLEATINDQRLSPKQQIRAKRNRAVVLMLLGEEDASISSLMHADDSDSAFLNCLKVMTMRYDLNLIDSESLKQVPNTLSIQARCIAFVSAALMIAPSEATKRVALLRQAQQLIHNLTQTALGISAIEIKTLSALITLQMGSPALALRKLSLPESLESAPAAICVLNAAIRVSSLIGLLPQSATDLHRALDFLQKQIELLSPSSQPQILRKLQLLTPEALVLASRTGNFPEAGLLLADDCLLNLRARPIQVYGVASLRPTSAANLIFEAFGREARQSEHPGGGQLESERKALLRSFGEQRYWFRSVCAAHIAFALLCLREITKDLFSINAAVSDLKRRFGYTPYFQQTQPHPELSTIRTTLMLLEEGELTAISAAKLLTSEGGNL